MSDIVVTIGIKISSGLILLCFKSLSSNIVIINMIKITDNIEKIINSTYFDSMADVKANLRCMASKILSSNMRLVLTAIAGEIALANCIFESLLSAGFPA